MRSHAFAYGGEIEQGIASALLWTKETLGLRHEGNPDVLVLRYGLFSVEDARRVGALAGSAPLRGMEKVLVISAHVMYREAQNALLKLFEEPPAGTTLFLVLPTLDGLLPTLRSRVTALTASAPRETALTAARDFLALPKEKRAALAKKLASGKDEEDRRSNRDAAVEIVNGIEALAYAAFTKKPDPVLRALLEDIAQLRSALYDRSAPVRMILEHVSLVAPPSLTRA
jgi:DNA polymerase III delta prime subunit